MSLNRKKVSAQKTSPRSRRSSSDSVSLAVPQKADYYNVRQDGHVHILTHTHTTQVELEAEGRIRHVA